MRRLLPARVSFGWLSLRWFNNLSLQARLLAGFGLILGLTALVAFVGVTSLQSGASRAHALYSQNTMGVHWANQVAVHTIAGAKDEQNALLELSNDPTRTAFPLKHGRDELALAKTAAAEYRKTITKSEESNRWKAVEDIAARSADGSPAPCVSLRSLREPIPSSREARVRTLARPAGTRSAREESLSPASPWRAARRSCRRRHRDRARSSSSGEGSPA